MIKIKVTRYDLNKYYLNSDDCPIANSIKRNFNTFNVKVFASCVYIDDRCYNIREKDNQKALERSQTLWGKIIGGFTIELKYTTL